MPLTMDMPVSSKWSVRTFLLYFKSLITCFEIFAISEYCLFEEQLDLGNQAQVIHMTVPVQVT